jgi:hypothetical protein
MNTVISFSNYYRYKTRLYAVLASQNIIGLDLYPRYFERPEKLLEVLEFSKSVKSTDDGYTKDAASGLYVRNHSRLGAGVSEADFETQFLEIRLGLPYWYTNATTYHDWVKINMEAGVAETRKAAFNLLSHTQQPVFVEAGKDDDIPVEHFYVEFVSWTTKRFSRNSVVNWPKQKGVAITKLYD